MRCQWQELLNILPGWMRQAVDEQGREDMQELRLRSNMPPQIVKSGHCVWLQRTVTGDDISFCLNTATRYSPWVAGSIREGYVTASGGHRIGLCGECVYDGQAVRNFGRITSLCIRVARDFEGISGELYKRIGSCLIIGSPGSGKTTFLRDLIRMQSNHINGSVAVLDERRELFPSSAGKFFFERGQHTDVLSGCKKADGLQMLLRTMGPSVIALDEITAQEDCAALADAAWCGVRLIATAHAANKKELFSRKLYQPILESKLFDTLVTIHPDKSWQEEVLKL